MSPDEVRVRKIAAALDGAIYTTYGFVDRQFREQLVRELCLKLEQRQIQWNNLLTQKIVVDESIPVWVPGQAISEQRRFGNAA